MQWVAFLYNMLIREDETLLIIDLLVVFGSAGSGAAALAELRTVTSRSMRLADARRRCTSPFSTQAKVGTGARGAQDRRCAAS